MPQQSPEPVPDTAIVTLTVNPALDVSSSVDHVVPERKLRCEAPCWEPGGGGINVSRALHKLGGGSLALYTRGGPTGQQLEALLNEEGITHQPVPIEGTTRESFAVFEAATGLQYRFNMPGPPLREREWQSCLEALEALQPAPAFIVASGGLPPGVPAEFYARVARLGREMGARVIIDTSGPPLVAAVNEGVFLIKPNQNELGPLIGSVEGDEDRQVAAVRELVATGRCEAVVISLGRAGALLVAVDGCERIPAPTVPIQSKVGAGDSMVAGIVLALARGEPVRNAARFGVAAGTAAVMTPGSELCRREDVERLYAAMQAESA